MAVLKQVLIVTLILAINRVLSFNVCEDDDKVYNKCIYVSSKGIANRTCWTGRREQPCHSLDLAFAGAQYFNNGSLLISIGPGDFSLSYSDNNTFKNRRGFSVQGNATTIRCSEWGAGIAFLDSSDIVLKNVSIVGCGIEQNTTNRNFIDNYQFLEITVAVYLLFCRNVNISMVTIHQSKGTGLALINTVGQVIIYGSRFEHNLVERENFTQPGGGGVIVKFTYCVPGDLSCNNHNSVIPPKYSSNAALTFDSCNFTDNKASTGKFMSPFHLYSAGNDSFNFGRGGGLAVIMKGSASNNTIHLSNCCFVRNTAEVGAGLYISVEDQSYNNTVLVQLTTFDSNECKLQVIPPSAFSTGGGVAVYFMLDGANTHHNNISFDSATFTNNLAFQGGGMIILSTSIDSHIASSNTIELSYCNFSANVARVGAAIDMFLWNSVSVHNSSIITPLGSAVPTLSNCKFTENGGVYNYSSKEVTNGFTFATVYVVGMPSLFSGQMNFTNNKGSALVIQATRVVFKEGTVSTFIGNSGRAGGALSMLGDSWIVVYPNTCFEFVNNSATEKGGAVYTLQTEQHSTAYSHMCFIRYYDPVVHPKHWNSNFYFHNNFAMKKVNSIHVTSLLPCTWPKSKNGTLNNTSEDVKDALCWNKTFTYYNSNCSKEIRTSPVKLNKDSSMSVFPGISHDLGIVATDERGNDVTNQTVFVASIVSANNSSVDLSFLYVSDNDITITGEQNTTAKIMIESFDSIAVEKRLNVNILPCPPGLILNKSINSCDCQNGAYKAFIHCSKDSEGSFSASIQIGTCISDDTEKKQVVVARCPFTLDYPMEYIPLPNKTNEFCSTYNRSGPHCSHCQQNYGVIAYSSTFKCVQCNETNITKMWLYYLVIEFVPSTFFFMVVFIFHIGVTSGAANGYIFFSQITSIPYNLLLVQIGWTLYQKLSTYFSDILPQLLTFCYGSWNLDFSWLGYKANLCLGESLSGLDIIALQYITTLYPLFLCAVTYIIIELHARNCRILVFLWNHCCYGFARLRRQWHANYRTSVIDAFATFILLSYTRFLQISMMLLTYTSVYNSSSKEVDRVARYDPSFKYFHQRHLIYASVSILVLATFGIIPPILLLLTPFKFFQRFLNFLKLNRPGLQTFLDAFQGCYKNGQDGSPDRRYFAGLYFIFRIVIFVVYTQLNDLYGFFSNLQLVYLIILLSFVFLQPYKSAKYNCIDSCLITLLAIINTYLMTCYAEEVSDKTQYCENMPVIYAAMLVPFTCMTLYVIYRCLACYEPFRRYSHIVWDLACTKCKQMFVDNILTTTNINAPDDEEFPDRMDNPTRYDELTWSAELQSSASVAESEQNSENSEFQARLLSPVRMRNYSSFVDSPSEVS